MQRRQLFKRRRQKKQQRITVTPQGEGLNLPAVVRIFKALDRALREGHDVLRIMKKNKALLCELYDAGCAPEQPDIQLLFKRMDLLGDGGLCYVQMLGGAGKVERFGHGQKTAELEGVHPIPPNFLQFPLMIVITEN